MDAARLLLSFRQKPQPWIFCLSVALLLWGHSPLDLPQELKNQIRFTEANVYLAPHEKRKGIIFSTSSLWILWRRNYIHRLRHGDTIFNWPLLDGDTHRWTYVIISSSLLSRRTLALVLISNRYLTRLCGFIDYQGIHSFMELQCLKRSSWPSPDFLEIRFSSVDHFPSKQVE